jgi:hypothetical protein
MQINSLSGGIPAHNSFLPNSAKVIRNPPMPRFGITNAPGELLTKTEATRSDEEIINDVIAIAKKQAQQTLATGKNVYCRNPELEKLYGEFISPYSPDRQAIFTKGLDSSLNEIKSRVSKPIPIFNMGLRGFKLAIDISSFELFLFGKSSVKANFGFSSNHGAFEVNKLNFFENGEPIGVYHDPLGWAFTPTKAEQARTSELTNAFHNAFHAEMQSGRAGTNANSTNFDFAAHNVSNQQNQAAQTPTTPTATTQQAISRYEQMRV